MSWNITGSIGCKLVPRGRSWRLTGTRLGMKCSLSLWFWRKPMTCLWESRGEYRGAVLGTWSSRLRTRRRTCLNMFASSTPSSWYMRLFQSAYLMLNRKTPRVPPKASSTATVWPAISRPLIIVAWSFIFHSPRSNSESAVCGQNASHRPRSRNDHCLPTRFAILHNRSTTTTCCKLKLLLKRSTTCSTHRTFEGDCTAPKMCQAKLLQGMRFELHIILSTYLCLFRLSFLGVFGRTGTGESFGGRTT